MGCFLLADSVTSAETPFLACVSALTKDPVVTALFGTLLGMLGTLGVELWKARHFAPKLVVTFDPDTDKTEVIERKKRGYQERYVRLKVKNTGRRTAKNCAGYLIDARAISCEKAESPYKDSMQLHWAYRDKKESLGGISLHPHAPYYLDVFHAPDSRNEICLRTLDQSSRYSDFLKGQGIYCLTILVVADDCAAFEKSVFVDWTDWKTFRVANTLEDLRARGEPKGGIKEEPQGAGGSKEGSIEDGRQ